MGMRRERERKREIGLKERKMRGDALKSSTSRYLVDRDQIHWNLSPETKMLTSQETSRNQINDNWKMYINYDKCC